MDLAEMQSVPTLSFDEMKQMLKVAEQRLKAESSNATKHGSVVSLTDSYTSLTDNQVTDPDRAGLLRLNPGKQIEPYLKTVKGITRTNESKIIKSSQARDEQSRPAEVQMLGTRAKEDASATTGPDWFNMPQTVVTDQVKRDLQLIRMRSVVDPKRHYKKMTDSKTSLVPQFSQIGTIKEGPTEYYSARLLRRERKANLVEDILSNSESLSQYRRKYGEVQQSKTSGKKKHYAELKAKRSKRRH